MRARNRNISGGDWEDDFRNATRLADKVTDRERLLILVTDAAFVQRDLVKALQLSEIMTREYPDDYSGRMICSYLRLAANDLQGWKEEVEQMLRARPNDAFSHLWKGLVLLVVIGDLEGAEVEARRVLEINPAFPAGFPYFCLPWVDGIRGDLTAARNGFRRLLITDMHRLGPVFQFTVRKFISRFFFFANEADLAFRLTTTSEWMTPRPPDSTVAAVYRLENALMRCELDKSDLCLSLLRDQAQSSIGLSRVEALGWLGIQLARMGETEEAERIRSDLARESREVPVGFFMPPLPEERAKAQRAFSSQIIGEIALQTGDSDRAIRYFEEVVASTPSQSSVFGSILGPRLYLVARSLWGGPIEPRRR